MDHIIAQLKKGERQWYTVIFDSLGGRIVRDEVKDETEDTK
jgi:hypothetical protein